MPLLRRKAHVIKASLPGDLEMDEEVFVVGCTGESFREYGDYLGAMKLYNLKVWCCCYTGRSGLTYAEALEEEAKATALLAKFPVEYEERVIRLIHHSSARLEELVNKIYEDLRPEEPGDKENGTKKVPKHPLPRSVLRRWVQEYAKETFVCGARVWVAKPDLMKKYELQTVLSLEGAAAIKFAKQQKKQFDKSLRKESPSSTPAQPPQGSIAAKAPKERQALKECTHPIDSSSTAQVPSNLRPGGMTHTTFLILWEMGKDGGRVDDIVRKAVEKGFPIEWTESKKRVLRSTLCHNSTMFSRLGGGVYALRRLIDATAIGNEKQPGSKEQASKVKENGHLSDDEVTAPICKNLEEAIAHLQCAVEAERKAKAATQALLKELNETQVQKEMNGETIQSKEGKGTKKHTKDDSTVIKSRKTLSNKIKESTAQLQKASKILQAAKEEVARKQLEVRGNGNVVPSKTERKLEREEQKRQEKEQKRLEALEAKRYPIDDMELLIEKQAKVTKGGSSVSMDVCLPHAMSPNTTVTTTGILYISEFLNQFGKALDLKSFNYQELSAIIFGGPEREQLQERSNPKTIVHLGHVYEKLLSVLLDEATADNRGTRKENRWYYVLGPGTWPEVVRRYILENQYAKKDESIVLAANALASTKPEELPPQQHIELLEFICDDVLCSEEMRSIIQKRLDLSESLARNMRTELAEGKQKLRDILDAEREERKRKRTEQEVAKQENGEGQALDEAMNGEETHDSKKAKITVIPNEPLVPCFELPEELQEYRGDPDDRKAMMLWRQKLQTAKRKLDRDQRIWEAEERKRQRAIDFVEKARKEEEAQKLREKTNAEDAVVRIQELYEKQFRQQTVRTETLGNDRYSRNYYWGLGGHQSVIYVEDSSGTWCIIDNMDDLLKLKDSLEVKGIRELSLKDALDRHWASIDKAMRRAAKHRESGFEIVKRELPKRTARVGLSKHRGGYPFGGVDQEAILMAKESIAEICDNARPARIECPHGTWKSWKARVAELPLCANEGESVTEVKEKILSFALELEEILVAGTGEESHYQDMDADDDNDGDVDSESDDQLHQSDVSIAGDSVDGIPIPLASSVEEEGTKTSGSISCDKNMSVANQFNEHLESEDDYSTPSWCIWNGSRERQSWRADASLARLPSHMAYSVLALAESAVPALEEFGRRFGGKK